MRNDPPRDQVQTPPDVKLAIKNTTTRLIKVVGIDMARTGYSANTEYWRNDALSSSNLDVSALAMEFGSALGEGDREIDTYFSPLTTNTFTPSRTAPIWYAGKRPGGARATYLFSMSDPDDSSYKLGVLIETTASTRALLLAVSFYKSFLRPDGQIWGTSNTPTADSTLTRVMRGRAPSTDPDDMGSTTWFHTVAGS